MNYPNPPQISIEIAQNGFLLRSGGQSPISLVYRDIAEAVNDINKIKTDYEAALQAWKEFQESRMQQRK